MTLNTIEADFVSSEFRQRVQGTDMERVAKTKRLTRIVTDEPIHQEDQMALFERRKIAQIHERASVLEIENATLRSRIEVLEQLAFADALTGLPNRLALEGHIRRAHDHARATGETLAFAIADIDLFKLVNDRFGHATGDAVLREVGLILRSHCRITDLAARLGGEEFAIVMPGLTRREAFNACQRLRRAVEEFDWSSITYGLKITLSIGLTDSICESPEATLALADRQMYRAKLEGRNRVRATRSGL
jgi:two-component system, cell cycle response regulator